MGNQQNKESQQELKQKNLSINELRRGGFGKVWKVKHKKQNKVYALKEMSKATIIDKRSESSINYERELLSKLKNKFIINMNYAFQDCYNLYIVLEYLTGGDLRYHLGKNQKGFNEEETKFFIACLVNALEYIHNNKVIHRDIKPENMVLDSKGYLHLTDFGIAKYAQRENHTETSGTPGYMAPEVMAGQNHNFVVDFFALGVFGYELMMRIRPYLGRNRQEIKEMIMAKQVIITENDIPNGWSWESADFINKLLQRKPMNRLGIKGIDQLKEHPWLKNYDFKSLNEGVMKSPFIPDSYDNIDYSHVNEQENIGVETKERYNSILADKSYTNIFKSFFYIPKKELNYLYNNNSSKKILLNIKPSDNLHSKSKSNLIDSISENKNNKNIHDKITNSLYNYNSHLISKNNEIKKDFNCRSKNSYHSNSNIPTNKYFKLNNNNNNINNVYSLNKSLHNNFIVKHSKKTFSESNNIQNFIFNKSNKECTYSPLVNDQPIKIEHNLVDNKENLKINNAKSIHIEDNNNQLKFNTSKDEKLIKNDNKNYKKENISSLLIKKSNNKDLNLNKKQLSNKELVKLDEELILDETDKYYNNQKFFSSLNFNFNKNKHNLNTNKTSKINSIEKLLENNKHEINKCKIKDKNNLSKNVIDKTSYSKRSIKNHRKSINYNSFDNNTNNININSFSFNINDNKNIEKKLNFLKFNNSTLSFINNLTSKNKKTKDNKNNLLERIIEKDYYQKKLYFRKINNSTVNINKYLPNKKYKNNNNKSNVSFNKKQLYSSFSVSNNNSIVKNNINSLINSNNVSPNVNLIKLKLLNNKLVINKNKVNCNKKPCFNKLNMYSISKSKSNIRSKNISFNDKSNFDISSFNNYSTSINFNLADKNIIKNYNKINKYKLNNTGNLLLYSKKNNVNKKQTENLNINNNNDLNSNLKLTFNQFKNNEIDSKDLLFKSSVHPNNSLIIKENKINNNFNKDKSNNNNIVNNYSSISVEKKLYKKNNDIKNLLKKNDNSKKVLSKSKIINNYNINININNYKNNRTSNSNTSNKTLKDINKIKSVVTDKKLIDNKEEKKTNYNTKDVSTINNSKKNDTKLIQNNIYKIKNNKNAIKNQSQVVKKTSINSSCHVSNKDTNSVNNNNNNLLNSQSNNIINNKLHKNEFLKLNFKVRKNTICINTSNYNTNNTYISSFNNKNNKEEVNEKQKQYKNIYFKKSEFAISNKYDNNNKCKSVLKISSKI